KARDRTPPSWSASVFTSLPTARSQSRTEPPRSPEATSLPSGEKASAPTAWENPGSRARRWPVAASHRLTLPSRPPETTDLPSGLEATQVTLSWCPSKGRLSLPVAMSHSRTTLPCDPQPSLVEETSVRPSGEIASKLVQGLTLPS